MRLLWGTAALFTCVGLSFSCGISVDAVRTGPRRAALPSYAPVKVFLLGKPSVPYVQLGMVEVAGGTAAVRLRRAKEVARRYGGNAIVSASQRTGVATTFSLSKEPGSTYSYSIHSFVVLYLPSGPHAAPPPRARPAPSGCSSCRGSWRNFRVPPPR